MKRYPKYKDSGIEWIGEIPEGWRINKLKQVTQFLYGDSLPNENRVSGNILVYGSNGVTGYHNISITKKPCIVIGRKGSFGKINYSIKECFPIDTTFYIDSIATNNDIRWLFYLLSILELDSISKDSAVPGLSREEAYEKITVLPSLSEQQSIASYLDRKTSQIDTLIDKKQKLIDLLKEYRTAIINHAVTKGLNPNVKMKDSGIEWIGEIPEEWRISKLKHFSDVYNGSTPKSGVSEYWNGDKVWLTPDDLGKLENKYINDSARKITELGLDNCGSFTTPSKSIVLSTRAPIGHIGITNVSSSTNQGCKSIVTNTNISDTDYVYYTIYGQKEELQSLGQGSTFIELSSQKLKDFNITTPPLSEQQTIASYLNRKTAQIDTLIDKKQNSINHLKEYRTALISNAVTGKIDVREEATE